MRLYSFAFPRHLKKWTIRVNEEEAEQRFGTYFLRTNVSALDERSAWKYYNLIREIETSNRQL